MAEVPGRRALHDKLIDEYRHAYHAHSHRSKRRTLLDTTDMLGFQAPPNYAEAWHGLTREVDLAERHAARMHHAADLVGAELGEERDRPSYQSPRTRIDFRWQDGVDTDTAFKRLREALGQQADVADA